jgi:1-aminocyclopropane-1-carboxylate deaminase/D-cysteine desulfhydrase-like pyridoxal-dependent ACC family enzyme
MKMLASHYPGLRSLPFEALTELPTPVEDATALAAELDLADLRIKRDDLSAPLYGGNKVRKLDFLLADALARKCDSVVTFGAAGSNHALATSIYAAERGLSCYAVLTDQPVTAYAAPTLRYHLSLGTQLVLAEGFQGSIRAADEIRSRHPTGADRVYEITWGGSSWLGAAAFVNAAFELASQLKGANVPDKIYVACGTMGTAVGLALGLRAADLSTKIVAVQVVPKPVATIGSFEKLFETTNRELHDHDASFPILDDPLDNVDFRSEFLGPGYAIPTPECTQAVRLTNETLELKLETTYTGKAMAALVHDARAGDLAGSSVMFWNTYNSRPFPAGLEAIPIDALPAPFRKYLND